jgi:hypothetical protein
VDFKAVWSTATKMKILRASAVPREPAATGRKDKKGKDAEAVWSTATKTKTRLSRG